MCVMTMVQLQRSHYCVCVHVFRLRMFYFCDVTFTSHVFTPSHATRHTSPTIQAVRDVNKNFMANTLKNHVALKSATAHTGERNMASRTRY